ncbi:MAG: hypothetical protein EXS42_05180 [Lacunisphaera sp.]|nr:hypothetical protein [Lacunisphaera sp.]
MNHSLADARVIPTLYATLPASFEEQVAGRMAYQVEGDNIYLMKTWVDEAEPEFKTTEMHAALVELFVRFPDHDAVVLQPA